MNSEIIAIGSELLTPWRQDTNSLFITERLNELGDAGIREFNERRRKTVIKQASQPAFDRGLGDDATYLNGAGFGTMDPKERVELLDVAD